MMRKNIDIYKANKKNSGAAAQFKMANDNSCMFLEIAKQFADMDSSKPYDWYSKIVVKLGATDICKLMSFFRRGMRDGSELKLFHKIDSGPRVGSTKTIKLVYQEKYSSFYMSITSKPSDGELQSISIPISLDEVEYLMVGFQRALLIILDW